MKSCLVILLLSLHCLVAESSVLQKAPEKIEFEVVSPLRPVLDWGLNHKSWSLRIYGLRIKTPQSTDQLKSHWGRGMIWAHRDQVVYAEGLSEVDFIRLIQESRSAGRPSFLLKRGIPPLFLAPQSWASSCDSVDLFRPLREIARLQFSQSASQQLGTCQISISEMVESEITKMGATISSVIDGSFFTQLSEGLSQLRLLIPELYSKLVVPAMDLFEAVPELARTLLCDVMKSKVSQFSLAMVTGGGGLPLAISRMTSETLDVVEKIKLLTRNRVILNHARALQNSGKLSQKASERLLKIESDLPSELKKGVSGFDGRNLRHRHVEKHSDEFKMNGKADDAYEANAKRFAKGTDKDNVAIKGEDGDYVKWNTRTEEVVVVRPDGRIRTYYKNSCKPAENQLLRLALASRSDTSNFCE